jgi:hypothetical protein
MDISAYLREEKAIDRFEGIRRICMLLKIAIVGGFPIVWAVVELIRDKAAFTSFISSKPAISSISQT